MKSAPWPPHVKILLAASAAIAVLFIGWAIFGPGPNAPVAAAAPATAPTDETRLVHIHAWALDRHFRANELAARRDLRGPLVVMCEVESVNEGPYGDPWVGCRADNEFTPVHLQFGKDQEGALAEVRKLERIWATCSEPQMFMGNVMATCSEFRMAPAK